MKRIPKTFLKCFIIFLLIINLTMFFGYSYIATNVGLVSIEELIFHLKVPIEGVSQIMVKEVLLQCVLPGMLILLIVILLCFCFFKSRQKAQKFIILFLLIVNIFFCIIQLYRVNKHFFVLEYIKNQINKSKFIEENYVNPQDVNISFEKKKNIILIYLESMETTFIDKNNGGVQDVNYIPELTKLALENINFSDTKMVGGAYQVSYASWTMAGMVAQSAGIPLLLPIEGNSYPNYDSFLPGSYSLGDVLNDNGYVQEIIFGSDSNFGGRKKYFETHGNYIIKDYYTAKEDSIIDKNHYVFWGYEDKYLFEYAQKELEKLSKGDKPFNLTLLTVDTHFPKGYLDSSCDKEYINEYANALDCSSAKIYEFINWIKKQDYFEDTTVVLIGDHISMANDEELLSIPVKKRRIYNVFINSAIETDNNKNRLFTSFDIYPTILVSMGASIEGNKLGLGVNLFSTEKTLLEKYGYDYLNSELSKRSDFYNRLILYGGK